MDASEMAHLVPIHQLWRVIIRTGLAYIPRPETQHQAQFCRYIPQQAYEHVEGHTTQCLIIVYGRNVGGSLERKRVIIGAFSAFIRPCLDFLTVFLVLPICLVPHKFLYPPRQALDH